MIDKPCTKCRHHRDIGSAFQIIHACGVELMYDPVDGEKVYRRCSAMRLADDGCGLEGRLWEQKE